MMITRKYIKNYFLTGVMCVALEAVPAFARPTETNKVAGTNKVADAEGKAAEDALIGQQESVRSNLQIQEQLHSALLAIERSREEAETAAARNAAMIETRLSAMEKSLAEQRRDELQNIQSSDRLVLIAAGIFATVGFLVLGAAAFLQGTAVNRLAVSSVGVGPANPARPGTSSPSTLAEHRPTSR